MADATANADAPKKPGLIGKLVKLILRLIFAAILLGVGFGAGYFYFANPLSPTQNALSLLAPEPEPVEGETPAEGEVNADGTTTGEPKRIPRELPETPVFETTYYQMEEALTTNLHNSRRYLQIGIGMSTQYDAQVMTNVETHKVAIRSDILNVMSNFAEEEVADAAGREKLADAIQTVINERLVTLEGFGGIEDVFFTSFVLQ